MIRECERGHRREESKKERKRRGEGEVKKLKILKEGKRITYILVRKKESSLLTVEPLITVENGEIRVEKKRITDLEEFYSLIAALKVAVWKFLKEKEKSVWRKCPVEERVWQFIREHDFLEAKEWFKDRQTQNEEEGETKRV